jgi:hypothetical protein
MKDKQQGLRNMSESRVPAIMDWSLVDERLTFTDEDAYRTARELARMEGILAGISSGTAVFAALQVARRERRGGIRVPRHRHNTCKGYSLRSTTPYGFWSGVTRRGRPRPVARKSPSVST